MSHKKKETDEIKEAIREMIKEERVEFISSGSTMINLAGSGKGKKGGWARGRIVNIVGDGSSGKTLLALEAAASAFYNMLGNTSENFPKVKKLQVVYNNVERVMDMPLEKMYGKKFVQGIEWIATAKVEEFGRDYTRRVMALKEGEFLLYILDSWDALTSEAGMYRFVAAAEKDKITEGSYGTEKAAYGSKEFFGNICSLTEDKDATLIIVSQIREKIGITFGEKYYRKGGKALDFFTHQVVWLSEIKKLKKTYHGHEMVYGIRCRARFKRNKTAKPFREAEFTILFDFGLDNLGSMIDWLWGVTCDKIEFDGGKFSRAEFIKYIEENEIEEALIEEIEKQWNQIENAIRPRGRRARFEGQEDSD